MLRRKQRARKAAALGTSGLGRIVLGAMRSTTRTLVVEARHLDTDERTVASFDVEVPGHEAGQRAQLAELVEGLHPKARMRSFGDGAASFLDDKHLVVTHYVDHGDAADEHAEPPLPARPQQQVLFAV
jgi:hypothetical protein